MKISSITRLLAFVGTTTMFASCATLFSGKTTPVVLVKCPSDLTVTENDSILELKEVQAFVRGNLDESVTTYTANGTEVNKKNKTHKLTLTSNGVSKEINVKLGAGANWAILDLFCGGWIVDAITGKWRVAKKRFVDVEAVLNGTKPRTQGQLKRAIKKGKF
jgi:hypothetical protein